LIARWVSPDVGGFEVGDWGDKGDIQRVKLHTGETFKRARWDNHDILSHHYVYRNWKGGGKEYT